MRFAGFLYQGITGIFRNFALRDFFRFLQFVTYVERDVVFLRNNTLYVINIEVRQRRIRPDIPAELDNRFLVQREISPTPCIRHPYGSGCPRIITHLRNLVEYARVLVIFIGNQLERVRGSFIIVRDYRTPVNIGNIKAQREAHGITLVHECSDSKIRPSRSGFR